jgi:hypothetical protein
MYQICLVMPSGKKIIFSGQGYDTKKEAEKMAACYSIIYRRHGGHWKVIQAISPKRSAA